MVRNVRKLKNTKKVYNLTVENSHSYLAENIGTFNSANVGLQSQLARYYAKREMFEYKWIRNKFLKVMAQRLGWYKRPTQHQRSGQIIIKKYGRELEESLVIPELIWDKKLKLRDDQSYLTFLHNVYAQGKGPVSPLTLLMEMGLSMEDELSNKQRQRELEQKYGNTLVPPAPAAGGAGAPPPPMGLTARLKDKINKFGKREVINVATELDIHNEEELPEDKEGNVLTGDNHVIKYRNKTSEELDEIRNELELTKNMNPTEDSVWINNLTSPHLSSEVIVGFNKLNELLSTSLRKSAEDFSVRISMDKDLFKIFSDIYMQGKYESYSKVKPLIAFQREAMMSKNYQDFSDLVLIQEFEKWTESLCKEFTDNRDVLGHVRDLGNTCFSFGQLRGYQEHGIEVIKVANVFFSDGIQYKIKDLLKKGRNLSTLISPNGDIAVFEPCIEGEEVFNIDPLIERYANFNVKGISIKDCPIEYKNSMIRFLNKTSKYIKKNYDNILFVRDVIELPEWETAYKKSIDSEFDGADNETKQLLVNASITQERLKKQGNLSIFNSNRNLYVSTWIGTKSSSLIGNLIKGLNLAEDESICKIVNSSFNDINCDLTRSDIDTYKIFGYIDPITDEQENVMGWRLNESSFRTANIKNEKLSYGKLWNSEGKCITAHEREAIQLSNENFRIWIDYTHKLDKNIKSIFDKL